ncbi:MAG: amino acid decarboxylase, partial [Eubacteriales bacterium]
PVLTGGAYLQISKTAPAVFTERAKSALVLFGSTSPSYLILKSLDLANKTLAEGYPAHQAAFLTRLASLKETLARAGYAFYGDEPMKLTIRAKAYGYTGKELASLLEEQGVIPEFADPDYLVLMPSPSLTDDDLTRLEKTLLAIPKKEKMLAEPPVLAELPERVMTPREALFAPRETLPTDACLGRVFASAALGCPPAVAPVVAGEVIDARAWEVLAYYGIRECRVVK